MILIKSSVPNKIVSSDGEVYASMRQCASALGISKTTIANAIVRYGYFAHNGKTYSLVKENEGNSEEATQEEETPKDATGQYLRNDPLFEKLKARYTEKELVLLAKGEGLVDKNMLYPKVNLTGKHHRIGVIADGHLGSKYSPIEYHLEAFKKFEEEECECIVHAGDLVDGLTPRRISTQIYELDHIGYKAQRDYAIEVFQQCNLPIYCISGNHDMYFNECAGANIVEDICNALPNMTYLGHNQADMDIDGVTMRIFHGIDGNSYALSYRLQKLVESYTGGRKPSILIAGHVHKFCYVFERHVHAISAPCLQRQTPFMQGKKLAAHTGFLIIEFDTNEQGVANFNCKFFPYYG